MGDQLLNILYFKQFFTGPDAPGSQQPRKLVRLLMGRGHRVDVIAADFNAYNEQDEPEERYEVEGGGGVRVHHLPSSRRIRRNLVARLRSYLGFAVPAYRKGLRLTPPDVVIGSI